MFSDKSVSNHLGPRQGKGVRHVAGASRSGWVFTDFWEEVEKKHRAMLGGVIQEVRDAKEET